MRPNPISKYAQLGLVCGGSASAVQAAVSHQPAPSVLLTAALGAAIGAVVGALYGYIKLRRAAR